MSIGGRIFRYFLEALAVTAVLLIPSGCDSSLNTLPSQLGDSPGSNDAGSQAAGGSQNADDDASGDDGSPTVAETPGEEAGDDTEDADAPDDDASPDDDGAAPDDSGDDQPGDEVSNPPDDNDDDPPPSDPGDDDPPADDSGDDDPPPDDPGDDDPPVVETDPEVPSNAYCDPVADWLDASRAFEEEVLVLVNQRRSEEATCGTYGSFAPAGPLTFDPALRCAARAHSMDMGERDFFSHTNPDGEGPGVRLSYAGYSGFGWGENIAWGYPTPAAVVAGWMSSDGHCANIMRSEWTIIGVGYYEGNIWTQTFGAH